MQYNCRHRCLKWPFTSTSFRQNRLKFFSVQSAKQRKKQNRGNALWLYTYVCVFVPALMVSRLKITAEQLQNLFFPFRIEKCDAILFFFLSVFSFCVFGCRVCARTSAKKFHSIVVSQQLRRQNIFCCFIFNYSRVRDHDNKPIVVWCLRNVQRENRLRQPMFASVFVVIKLSNAKLRFNFR